MFKNCYWFPHEVKDLVQVRFGPLKMAAQSRGVLRNLFAFYGGDCLERGEFWNHSGRLKEKVTLIDFNPAPYVISDENASFSKCINHESDAITLASLVRAPQTAHIKRIEQLFDKIAVRNLLEFGVGKDTKYYLEHCKALTSVEIIRPEESDGWYRLSRKLFSHYSQWTPILFTESGKETKKTRAAQLSDLVASLLKEKAYEFAIIDQPLSIGKCLIDELFEKIPIIAMIGSNDPKAKEEIESIVTPHSYTRMQFPEGRGVTFWMHNDQKEIAWIDSEKN